MRGYLRTGILCVVTLVAVQATTWGQTSGRVYSWLGDVSSDAADPGNWLDTPDPDTGTVPGAQDFVEFKCCERPATPVEYGAASPTYERVLFNHAPEGTTINGSGTMTLTRNGGPQNVDVKSLETQGGERLSTVNINVVALGLIEARNGHDIQFNGSTTASTVHAYVDGAVTSDVIFNGQFIHTGYGEAKFLTGDGTVRFNNEVVLDHQVEHSGFGIRNGMTAILGQNFSAIRFLPGGGGGLGLDTVDMYNNSTVRLAGDFVVGGDTDLFSRFGDGQNPNNTLDLDGHSDAVEFLGTHAPAIFNIDFGDGAGANSFLWETTHHHFGTYKILNFEVGVDTLTLGNVGTMWWTDLDAETDGNASEGRPNVLDKFAAMTINGVNYAPFDAGRTTPYWTIVDPDVSRDVAFFNFSASNPDFDGNSLVDGKDFLIWQRGLGLTGQTSNANGDANRDGVVNGADLTLWRNAFGESSVAAIGAVPEPASMILLIGGAVSVAGAVRRWRTARG